MHSYCKFWKLTFCVACEAYQHIGLTWSGVSVCSCVCPSGSHIFLEVICCYILQATHSLELFTCTYQQSYWSSLSVFLRFLNYLETFHWHLVRCLLLWILYTGNFSAHFIFTLFAPWCKGKIITGKILLFAWDYILHSESGQIQDWMISRVGESVLGLLNDLVYLIHIYWSILNVSLIWLP